jgi:hypothetical protein
MTLECEGSRRVAGVIWVVIRGSISGRISPTVSAALPLPLRLPAKPHISLAESRACRHSVRERARLDGWRRTLHDRLDDRPAELGGLRMRAVHLSHGPARARSAPVDERA